MYLETLLWGILFNNVESVKSQEDRSWQQRLTATLNDGCPIGHISSNKNCSLKMYLKKWCARHGEQFFFIFLTIYVFLKMITEVKHSNANVSKLSCKLACKYGIVEVDFIEWRTVFKSWLTLGYPIETSAQDGQDCFYSTHNHARPANWANTTVRTQFSYLLF